MRNSSELEPQGEREEGEIVPPKRQERHPPLHSRQDHRLKCEHLKHRVQPYRLTLPEAVIVQIMFS